MWGPQLFGAALTGAAVAALGSDEHVRGGAIERVSEGALAVAAAVEVRGVDVAYAGAATASRTNVRAGAQS